MVSWPTCLYWILACAVGSALFSITSRMPAMMLETGALAQSIHLVNGLIRSPVVSLLVVVGLLLLVLLLPSLIYYTVLRRMAPRLSASAWLTGMAFTAFVLACYAYYDLTLRHLFTSAAFGIGLGQMATGTLWKFVLVPLPAALGLALPCRIVAGAAERPWLAFFAAAGLATWCESALRTLFVPNAGGGSLPDLAAHLNAAFVLGAIWGAVSAGTLAWLLRRPRDAINAQAARA